MLLEMYWDHVSQGPMEARLCALCNIGFLAFTRVGSELAILLLSRIRMEQDQHLNKKKDFHHDNK